MQAGWVWDLFFERVESVEEPQQSAVVTLHVYDLSSTFVHVNTACRAWGGFGAFHVGVEVHDLEWTFSADCGVSHQKPLEPWGTHVFRESLEIGSTNMSAEEVHNLCFMMWKKWKPASYELYTRNCCHFADALCIELGVGSIPDWTNNLAKGLGVLSKGVGELTYLPRLVCDVFASQTQEDETAQSGRMLSPTTRRASLQNAKLDLQEMLSPSSRASLGGA